MHQALDGAQARGLPHRDHLLEAGVHERLVGPGRQQLEAILERERARGGQPPTLERTTDAVLAPLYYRGVFTDEPLTPEWTRTLVAHLLPD
ncbi:TetR-like C-terminal domain-containing protein [Streptomyces sp. RK9]|uniref:TetR-like C-terminal domain-containing protein n=1 Tax=Streptomyces sp. RK9 TaxID=3239284 RepID=UPI00386F47A9